MKACNVQFTISPQFLFDNTIGLNSITKYAPPTLYMLDRCLTILEKCKELLGQYTIHKELLSYQRIIKNTWTVGIPSIQPNTEFIFQK